MINKDEIVSRISFVLGENVDKKTTKDVVEGLFEILIDVLKKGEDVRFSGFGIFSTQIRKGREGVNPQNPSVKIQIPDTRIVKFKPSSVLKKTIKEHKL